MTKTRLRKKRRFIVKHTIQFLEQLRDMLTHDEKEDVDELIRSLRRRYEI